MINIKFKNIAISAYLYIILPIIIFFLTWLKFYIGIPMVIILVWSLIILLKKDYLNNAAEISLPKKHLIGISITILLWTWLSGQGGFFFQTWDYHWRNAVFRDLINFEWPVIYSETGNALVYYIMHWIVPALFGKLFGWTGGNIVLLLWTYIGLMITYILILYVTKGNSIKHMWITVIIFITWSGLNNLGLYIMNFFNQGGIYQGAEEEWLNSVTGIYVYSYQYSGNNTLLSWVFNQTIVPWIAVPLALENRRISSFAFLGLVILPYAPIPFIGFLPVFIAFAIHYYLCRIKEKNYQIALKETLSIPNLVAVCTIFPIFLAFYKCNNMNYFGLYVPVQAYDLKRICILMLFYLLEFGIYMLLIYKEYKRDILYYVVGISLIVIPIFRIGAGGDFCMRASIPSLFILMIMVLRYIFSKKYILNILNITLILVLSIAALNPFMDYVNKAMEIYSTRQFPIVSDNIKTFSDKQLVDENLGDIGHFENFLNTNPKAEIFYKYFAK